MSEVGILILLYAVGVAILLAEIFIPSHGVLTLTGLGFLVAAIVRTFDYGGRDAGILAVFACLIFLPTMAYFSIKYWHLTPIGRRIAPPNPTLTVEDAGVPLEDLGRLIGRTGQSETPLRPVGICRFDGKRISCVAEFGMIESGTEVSATHIVGSNLAVRAKKA